MKTTKLDRLEVILCQLRMFFFKSQKHVYSLKIIFLSQNPCGTNTVCPTGPKICVGLFPHVPQGRFWHLSPEIKNSNFSSAIRLGSRNICDRLTLFFVKMACSPVTVSLYDW